MEVPSGTEALIDERGLHVIAADGPGVAVDVDGARAPVIVGEGQEFTITPDADPRGDLYALRSPLAASVLDDAFLKRSRNNGVVVTSPKAAIAASAAGTDALVLTAPVEQELVTASTIVVQGTVSDAVDRVRVNGYAATIDRSTLSFQQELTVVDAEIMEIRVEALDEKGLTLQEIRRIIRRDMHPPEPPTIDEPAPQGSVYKTGVPQFEIRGSAPEGTHGIIVNDYRLQLFQPGSRTWSYLASQQLNNMKTGMNTFAVVAIDDANNRSEPVELTVILEEDAEPQIISTASSSSAGASVPASSVSSMQLLNNPPLKPGSLAVTSPAVGTSATMTSAELFLEGTNPPEAAGVWVNDYQLRLFSPGKGTWSFIARSEWGTLKEGTNTFIVVARNDKGEVLDVLEYTVNKVAVMPAP